MLLSAISAPLCWALWWWLLLAFRVGNASAITVQAPPVAMSAFEESAPMLFASQLVYNFAHLLEAARRRDIGLGVPKGFPVENLERFLDESLDLREFNGGAGISVAQLFSFLEHNREAIDAAFDDDFAETLMAELRARGKSEDVFLATYRGLQGKVACVYGVVKDEANKRVIVSFRGSQAPFSNRDWRSNFNARLVNMRTPKKIKDKMKGAVKEGVLVHEGFYNYLFNNEFIDGQQRYDQIIEDIKPLMEEGYSLYVTGHSLGGALATMFSFKLAGAGKHTDWVPRPLTCITFAAPFGGSKSYRAAFEQEEIDGLIRSLRINIGEDLVPALPPLSLGWKKHTMKHTGINLRLFNGGFSLSHSSKPSICNTFRNSIFKPLWNGLEWHLLPLHQRRLEHAKDKLSGKTIDELYKDDTVVGKQFVEGRVSGYDENEKGYDQ